MGTVANPSPRGVNLLHTLRRRDEAGRTGDDAHQVNNPPQDGEYQAALCLKTSMPVGDSILARGKVYGYFKTVQWYQDETEPDGTDYCTLLDLDFAHFK